MHQIKYFLGKLLSILFPAKTANLLENFTIPQDWNGRGLDHTINKLIRYYLRYRAKQQEVESPGKLEEIHRNFWAQTDSYFDETQDRAAEVFIPNYADLVQQLIPLLTEKHIHTVCEFGTGDGQWLNYLSQQWTAVTHFIGIDISAHQIEINKAQFPHITFYHADLVEWMGKNATDQTLYHTNGGVLEYLSEESVRKLINIIGQTTKGSLVLLNEPLYGDFDINTDKASKVSGAEFSYSHNHPHLLKTAGAQILHQEEKDLMGHRMLTVLAFFT